MGNMIGKRYSSEFATCDTRNLDYSKHRHPEAVHVVYPQIQMEGPGDSTMVKCDPNVDRPAFLLWLYTSFKADITISCPVRLNNIAPNLFPSEKLSNLYHTKCYYLLVRISVKYLINTL